jgi:hypothetical protein
MLKDKAERESTDSAPVHIRADFFMVIDFLTEGHQALF